MKLDLKDFIVLIGPQASGKSTIAKTIFFFKSLRDDLVNFFVDLYERKDAQRALGLFGKTIRKKFIEFFGTTWHMSGLYLKYTFKENIWLEITLEQNHRYITPNYSPRLKNFFNDLVKYTVDFLEKTNANKATTTEDLWEKESHKNTFYKHIKNEWSNFLNEKRKLIFIPAGRSLLATLSEQLQNISSRNLDYLTKSFLKEISLIRPIFNKSLQFVVNERKLLTNYSVNEENTKKAIEIIKNILKGYYQVDSQGEKIYHNPQKYVKLNFASSGQQEALWILMLLFLVILENQEIFIVIEEPEAHLYPQAQKFIIDLIALVSNINNNQVLITTHSPYILAAINNLMFAYNVAEKNVDISETIKKRISEKLWLNPAKVYAADMVNGKIEKIIDDELLIIQNERIDTASRIINEDFDFLFNL